MTSVYFGRRGKEDGERRLSRDQVERQTGANPSLPPSADLNPVTGRQETTTSNTKVWAPCCDLSFPKNTLCCSFPSIYFPCYFLFSPVLIFFHSNESFWVCFKNRKALFTLQSVKTLIPSCSISTRCSAPHLQLKPSWPVTIWTAFKQSLQRVFS